MCFATGVYHHHFRNYATYQHFNPGSTQNVCHINLVDISSQDPPVI